jgi:lipoate-protein ligase A
MTDDAPYIVVNNNVEPYFNLALEEYLLKEFDNNCFMLWRNEPCIVVGRNQNTITEINSEYVKKHRIKVVRRLSGGGAVFHDLGNLNFTFIIKDAQNSFYNFHKFTAPIIEALDTLGVKAELSGRNDLTITNTGQKFSGNAQYRYKGKLLHHGTILFNATINDMTASLKVNPGKLDSKGVKSVSSRVTNIQNHLSQPLTIAEFENMIRDYIILFTI